MNRYYAGIGARKTSKEVLEYFYQIGYFLASRGFILRSGAADGADKYFELGCDKANGKKEIYLPWRHFGESDSNLIVSNMKAYDIAEKFHPYWRNLSVGARKLQSRNSHQVLGFDLETPSEFVLCWTQDGKGEGGTGQAIRVAKYYRVPVFDAGKYEDVDGIKRSLKEFLIENKVFGEDEISSK